MSKKITEMPEVQSLLDTDFLTGIERAALPASQNVKIQKLNLGFAADDDPRLSDSRDPNAHASTHATLGDDPIAPVDIGAEPTISPKNNAFNKSFGTGNDDVARGDAPVQVQGNLDTHIGTGAATAHADAATLTDLDNHKSAVDGLQHQIAGIAGLQTELDGKKDDFAENTAFNKDFGTGNGDVARGDAPVQVQGNLDTHEADVANPHSTTFLKLGDTPADYVGQAGKRVAVNAVPNGVEFIDPDTFLDLPDTPATYTGEQGKYVAVKAAQDGVEFVTPPSGGSAHVIQNEGSPLAQQPNLNFTGAGVLAEDDAANNATKVTITSGTPRHIIQDDTVVRPDQPNLNFVGLLVRAEDNAANNATDVTVDPVELLNEAEIPVTKRPVIRFSGAGVAIADNGVDFRTEITINGVPVAHAASHRFNGSDPLSPADIQAVPETREINTLAGSGLQGGDELSSDIDLSLTDTAVAPGGSFTNANFTVDAKGRITAASNGTPGHNIKDEDDANLIQRPVLNFRGNIVQATDNVTNNRTEVEINGVPESRQVIAGTGLSGGGALSGNVTLDLADVGGGVEGDYTNANISVNAQGQITAAANGAGGGASNFTDLNDTPANYSTHGGKQVRVKGDETGLEFVASVGGADTFLDLTDTPSSYAGQAGNIPVVNSTPNGLEFEARNDAFNKSFGSIAGSVCEGDDPRLSDKRSVVNDVVLNGYIETQGTGLPTTGTITVPLDGRIHEVTLTGDATIDVGAVPGGGNVGSAILFLTPAGNNVSYAVGLYWAGGAAVAAGAYMRYTVSNAPGGNKIIDAEELAAV